MKPTFENTVGILVKAYLNDELEHGDCEACAVGNIVHAAGAPRYNIHKMPHDSCGMWKNVFFTDLVFHEQTISRDITCPFYKAGLEVIELTGYHWQELARVEFVFETAPEGRSEDEHMFNGLMAVVDVLAEIHNVDLSVRESAKLQFVKP